MKPVQSRIRKLKYVCIKAAYAYDVGVHEEMAVGKTKNKSINHVSNGGRPRDVDLHLGRGARMT